MRLTRQRALHPHCATARRKPSWRRAGPDSPHSADVERLDRSATDKRALDDLFSAAYEELRRLASAVRRDDPGATLSPTALVNEAWLKLADSPAVAQHVAAALQAHRRARNAPGAGRGRAPAERRQARRRRGGRDVRRRDEQRHDRPTTCSRSTPRSRRWRGIEPRQALMVESRFFGGLDVAETAPLLEVSEATVLRDWRAAKAWLARELRRRS